MPSGKFAVTYTAKNESRLLPSGVEYLLAARCSRIYISWDNTSDSGPELMAKYPEVVARPSWFFYEIRFAGALKRMMREPVTGRRIPGTYFLGYASYKSFIWTRVAHEFAFAVHSRKPFVQPPRDLITGNILHFDVIDASQLISKYRQRPPARRFFYLRYLLDRVAQSLPRGYQALLREIQRYRRSYPHGATEEKGNRRGNTVGLKPAQKAVCQVLSHCILKEVTNGAPKGGLLQDNSKPRGEY